MFDGAYIAETVDYTSPDDAVEYATRMLKVGAKVQIRAMTYLAGTPSATTVYRVFVS